MLYKVALTFESVDEILKYEATDQYFPLVDNYKAVITIASADDNLQV